MTVTKPTTPNYIIEEAFKLIGVYTEFQGSLPGNRLAEGINLLNSIIETYGCQSNMIAYDDLLTFNLVVGQREYVLATSGGDVVSNRLVDIQYVTITRDDIQRPVDIVSKKYYYERPINLSLQGCPVSLFLQNQDGANRGSSKLVFLIKPDYAYSCTIVGKFVLSYLTLGSNIINVPDYYLEFLKYSLADYLKDRYPGSLWDKKKQDKLDFLSRSIQSMTDIDISSKTGVALNNNNYFDIMAGY